MTISSYWNKKSHSNLGKGCVAKNPKPSLLQCRFGSPSNTVPGPDGTHYPNQQLHRFTHFYTGMFYTAMPQSPHLLHWVDTHPPPKLPLPVGWSTLYDGSLCQPNPPSQTAFSTIHSRADRPGTNQASCGHQGLCYISHSLIMTSTTFRWVWITVGRNGSGLI